jgi:hypothetical protein
VSPVRHELRFNTPEDDILHSHCRENIKSNQCLNFRFLPSIYNTRFTATCYVSSSSSGNMTTCACCVIRCDCCCHATWFSLHVTTIRRKELPFSTLKEAGACFEPLVPLYRPPWRHNTQNRNRNTGKLHFGIDGRVFLMFLMIYWPVCSPVTHKSGSLCINTQGQPHCSGSYMIFLSFSLNTSLNDAQDINSVKTEILIHFHVCRNYKERR